MVNANKFKINPNGKKACIFKELRNYNRKFFLCRPQKQVDTQTTF